MAVVALIPTGKLEHTALAPALTRLFPEHTFVVLPPEKHLDGFTSRNVAPLTANPPAPVPTNLADLAKELVNAILPGRRRQQRIDFAFVVEDLELCNRGQPELVLRLFRDAVDLYINEAWPQQSLEIYGVVREQCSFHLLCPMIEAYFYGDPAALQRARTVRPLQIPDSLDLEQFQTVDRVFLDLAAGTDRIANMPEREFHPKSYLHYLCDPTLADRRTRYRETVNGVAALELLDWERVLGTPPHCPFLHALLDDLAEALNCQLPFVNSARADPRARFPGPKDRILRNL
jgi:hypothetical protein